MGVLAIPLREGNNTKHVRRNTGQKAFFTILFGANSFSVRAYNILEPHDLPVGVSLVLLRLQSVIYQLCSFCHSCLELLLILNKNKNSVL